MLFVTGVLQSRVKLQAFRILVLCIHKVLSTARTLPQFLGAAMRPNYSYKATPELFLRRKTVESFKARKSYLIIQIFD